MLFIAILLATDPTGQYGMAGLGLSYASTHILILVMANTCIYTAFYVSMKLLCGERLTLWASLYLVGAILLAILASVFFFRVEESTDTDPAESRQLNLPCFLLDFYSMHDTWHFLSAGACFSALMFLLTVDDDIRHKERTQILVF